MTRQEFLHELYLTKTSELLWQSCPSTTGIRGISVRKTSTGTRFSPITAVCRFTKKKYYGVHEWKKAAAELGLDAQLAEFISTVSDDPPKSDEACKLRKEMLFVLGIQDISIEETWQCPDSILCCEL